MKCLWNQRIKVPSLSSHLDWFQISPLCFLFSSFSLCFLNTGRVPVAISGLVLSLQRSGESAVLKQMVHLSYWGPYVTPRLCPVGRLKPCRLPEVDSSWFDIKMSIPVSWDGLFERHRNTYQLFAFSASVDFRINSPSSVVLHAFKLRTMKAEAGGLLWVWSYSELLS